MDTDLPLIRWRAVAYYRTASGALDVTFDLEELAELHERIEGGPHWDTIEKIEVFRVDHSTAVDLTGEQAEEL